MADGIGKAITIADVKSDTGKAILAPLLNASNKSELGDAILWLGDQHGLMGGPVKEEFDRHVKAQREHFDKLGRKHLAYKLGVFEGDMPF